MQIQLRNLRIPRSEPSEPRTSLIPERLRPACSRERGLLTARPSRRNLDVRVAHARASDRVPGGSKASPPAPQVEAPHPAATSPPTHTPPARRGIARAGGLAPRRGPRANRPGRALSRPRAQFDAGSSTPALSHAVLPRTALTPSRHGRRRHRASSPASPAGRRRPPVEPARGMWPGRHLPPHGSQRASGGRPP